MLAELRSPQRLWTIALAGSLGLAAVLAVCRPLWWGAEPGEVLRHTLFVALFVVVPGWCLARAWGPRSGDPVLELGQGAALGLVSVSLVFLALHAVGLGRWSALWPLVTVPAVLALRARRDLPVEPDPPSLARGHVLTLALLVAAVALRARMADTSEWILRMQHDTLFHAGNAAALAREVGFDNPRMAGVPFRYHVFTYAPFAMERLLLGVPVEALFMRVAVQTLPLVLLLQVFNAARVTTGSTAAGSLAAAFVMLHVDAGQRIGPSLGRPMGVLNSLNFLDVGIYTSPSTCAGLIAFATLMIHLHGWLVRGTRSDLVLAALFAFYASGAKGSVMPVVIAGLALTALVCWRRGSGVRRAVVACAVMVAVSAPMTLWLARGDESYASSMFHVLPWASLRRTQFFQIAADALAIAPGVRGEALLWCLAPFWLFLYLGFSGCFGAAAAWVRRRELGVTEWLLAGCAASGLVAASLLSAPGESQLFFAYNGSIALAILAAGALVRRALPRGLAVGLAIVLGLPFAAGIAIESVRVLRAEFDSYPPEPVPHASYRAALEWMREHTPPDAVVMTSRREVLYSVRAERACFYETEHYTPRWAAAGWQHPGPWGLWRKPEVLSFPARNEVNARVLEAPDRASIAAARSMLGDRRPLYVVFDRFVWDAERGARGCYLFDPTAVWPEPDPDLLRIVFENEAARVCAVSETPAPR